MRQKVDGDERGEGHADADDNDQIQVASNSLLKNFHRHTINSAGSQGWCGLDYYLYPSVYFLSVCGRKVDL